MASKSAAARRDAAPASRNFAARFSEAIRARTYPNTSLHPKQLAGITGYSSDSFMRWWRGEARIPAEAIDSLVTFFEGQGDRAFLYELFGKKQEALNAKANELRLRLEHLQSRIHGNGDTPTADRGGVAHAGPAASASSAADGQGRVVGTLGRAPDGQVAAPAADAAP